MNDDEVLCEIKWTVTDVKAAFRKKHKREPTERELSLCVWALDTKTLEERSIEIGWTIVDEAIM